MHGKTLYKINRVKSKGSLTLWSTENPWDNSQLKIICFFTSLCSFSTILTKYIRQIILHKTTHRVHLFTVSNAFVKSMKTCVEAFIFLSVSLITDSQKISCHLRGESRVDSHSQGDDIISSLTVYYLHAPVEINLWNYQTTRDHLTRYTEIKMPFLYSSFTDD